MKIIKLKYIAFCFVSISLFSCSNEVIEKKDANSINSFELEENINTYIVDGRLINEKSLIVEAANKAKNILYDIPNNQIIISTTKQELNKLIERSPEYKDAFVEPTNNVASDDISKAETPKDLDFSIPKAIAKPSPERIAAGTGVFTKHPTYDLNIYDSENDSNDLVLHNHYTAGGSISVYFNADIALGSKSDAGTNQNVVKSTSQDSNPVTTTSLTSSQFGISENRYGYSLLINHSNVKKSLTVYQNKNYGGLSKTVILNPGQRLATDLHLTFPYTTSSGTSYRDGGKSYKLVNL